MNDFKFRVGQTVYSPFGVVKIIARWHGKSSTFYDVKFTEKNNDIVQTKTWTFEEHEMIPFGAGGIAFHDDDSVEVVDIKEIDEDLIVTVLVWVQVEIDGKFYTIEKQFQEKLLK